MSERCGKTGPAGIILLGVEQRPRRALGIARGAKLATFEAIENAVGREEAETVIVTRDDPGSPVSNFDDIGFGHTCSFAGNAGAPV